MPLQEVDAEDSGYNSHGDNAEYTEAFALFDEKGTGAVPRGADYMAFLTILNRPNGFKPAGTPSTWTIWIVFCWNFSPEEFIRGCIGAGELRYVLTQLGEKTTDEVDELLKGVQIGADGNMNSESFVRAILRQCCAMLHD
ncbi:hypothetical protein V8B97DRAFT_2026193 [Scleroderma yunnanense]